MPAVPAIEQKVRAGLNLATTRVWPILTRNMTPENQRCLRAAEGWLELGDWQSALDELAGISPAYRDHPNVLDLRWSIHAKAGNWNACVEVGTALKKFAPDRETSWIHHAYALHELKRTPEAWASLSPAAQKFPAEPTVFYNLACYACQMGKLDEARTLLDKAFKLGDADVMKLDALNDPDLAPLRLDEN